MITFMIYAEHAWKTNPKGEPLGKYFREAQWSATSNVRRLVDGKFVTFPNSGWVATETPVPMEPTPEPEPLAKEMPKAITPKKTRAKKPRKKKE